MDLNLIWFILLGVLLAGYAVLDGFDFGVGMLHLLARGDDERRTFIATIGPVWDGNEVWLVTFGGALVRRVSRSLRDHLLRLLLRLHAGAAGPDRPRRIARFSQQDQIACLAEDVGRRLLSVQHPGHAAVRCRRGQRDDRRAAERTRHLHGRLLQSAEPLRALVGLLAVAMFVMHGCDLPAPEDDRRVARSASTAGCGGATASFVVMYLAGDRRHVDRPCRGPRRRFKAYPVAWLIVVVNLAAVLSIPWALYRNGRAGRSSASCLTVCAFVLLLGLALFPNLVTSNPNPGQQPDDLQCRVQPEDAGHHADRRRHRHALRDGLHLDHLLGLPRQRGRFGIRALNPGV